VTKKSKEQSESYEARYQQLQAIVQQLEQGELPLEELLQLYERGVHLAAACQQMLDQAELRVQVIQQNQGSTGV
jgi:exodeoxyribonuclease VII small subunit